MLNPEQEPSPGPELGDLGVQSPGAVQPLWMESMTSKGAGLEEEIMEIIQSTIQGIIGSERTGQTG